MVKSWKEKKKILGLKNYVLGKCEVTVHVQQKYQGTKSAFKCFWKFRLSCCSLWNSCDISVEQNLHWNGDYNFFQDSKLLEVLMTMMMMWLIKHPCINATKNAILTLELSLRAAHTCKMSFPFLMILKFWRPLKKLFFNIFHSTVWPSLELMEQKQSKETNMPIKNTTVFQCVID